MGSDFGIYHTSVDQPVLALGATLGGLVLFYRGFRLLERERLIENTPASKIRSAALGLIEVSGLAVGPYTLPAPITGASCFYYRTLAWELRKSTKSEEWHKVADETLHVPFYLDDNTGRVLVNPQGAQLDLDRDFHQEYHPSFFAASDMPPSVRAFLGHHGISDEHKIRVEEYLIKPNNLLFVLGTLAENPGTPLSPNPLGSKSVAAEQERQVAAATLAGDISIAEKWPGIGRNPNLPNNRQPLPEPPQEIIYLSHPQPPVSTAGMTQQARIAAALTRAGITNPAAWKGSRVEPSDLGSSPADRLPFTQATVGPSTEDFDLQPRVVVMKGQNNATFLISWRSQREVLRSMGWRAAAYIGGGPALTLIGVYILLAHFGWL